MSIVGEPPRGPAAVEVPVAAARPRRRGGLRRVALTLLLCLGVLIVGVGLFNLLSSQKREPPRQSDDVVTKTYNVSVFRVEPATLQRILPAFGTAQADREVVMAVEVAGRVVEVNDLDVGRAVSAPHLSVAADGTTRREGGSLLLRIDPSTYQERVLQMKKRVAQDDVELRRLAQEHQNNLELLKSEQANLRTTREEYDSQVRLDQQGAGTATAIRRAELEMRQYEDAVLRLEQELGLYEVRREQLLSGRDAHESDLELAQQNLRRTELYPPFDAVVSEVMIEQGQYVGPGEPCVRLTDPTRVEIPLSLTLADYLEIASAREDGNSPRVMLSENETAEPRWFSDPLEDLRQAPVADEATRTVKIYVEVDNSKQEVPLLPGTFVFARVEGQVTSEAIVIPRDCIVEGTVFVAVPEARKADGEAPESSSPTTWYARAERRPITVARTLQSLAEVSQGLAAGEWVVMTNLDVMFEGARLKIEPEEGERQLVEELARLRTPQVQILP